jgi:hypothetical protein
MLLDVARSLIGDDVEVVNGSRRAGLNAVASAEGFELQLSNSPFELDQ